MWWFVACARLPDAPADTGPDRPARPPALEGRVSDVDGEPLDAVLMACASVCVVAWTDPDGGYRFDALADGEWSIHAAATAADSAQLVIPWRVDGPGALDLTIPALEPPQPVPEVARAVALADGLEVSLSAAALPGVAEVRAARIPAEQWPAGLELPGPPTVGWTLAPAGAGMALPFVASGAGSAWCSSGDGLRWEPCDGLLPNLGSIVLVD